MNNKYGNWHKKFFSGLWNEVQLKMYSVIFGGGEIEIHIKS